MQKTLFDKKFQKSRKLEGFCRKKDTAVTVQVAAVSTLFVRKLPEINNHFAQGCQLRVL